MPSMFYHVINIKKKRIKSIIWDWNKIFRKFVDFGNLKNCIFILSTD